MDMRMMVKFRVQNPNDPPDGLHRGPHLLESATAQLQRSGESAEGSHLGERSRHVEY